MNDINYRTFPCPNCREVIDTTMQSCKYCGAAIDPAVATAAADLQERVQQACGQASSTRITARAMPVLFLLSFIPFIGGIFLVGTAATVVLVPINWIRWRLRFGKLESRDPDLLRARRAMIEAILIWAMMTVALALWTLFRLALVQRAGI